MSNIEDIKEKISKLIAKEESAREIGNLAEAEAFAAKVQQLLLQYELDVKDLKNQTGESLVIIEKRFDTKILTTRHESNWAIYLYNACAKACFCTVLAYGRSAATTFVTLIGTEVNIEMLHLMASRLAVQIRKVARIEFARYVGPDKRNTWIRGFLKGACHGISQKLRNDAARIMIDQPQMSALVHDKDASMRKYMEEHYPKLGVSKGRAGSSTDGYLRGKEVGSTMDVNQSGTRLTGGRKLLN